MLQAAVEVVVVVGVALVKMVTAVEVVLELVHREVAVEMDSLMDIAFLPAEAEVSVVMEVMLVDISMEVRVELVLCTLL